MRDPLGVGCSTLLRQMLGDLWGGCWGKMKFGKDIMSPAGGTLGTSPIVCGTAHRDSRKFLESHYEGHFFSHSSVAKRWEIGAGEFPAKPRELGSLLGSPTTLNSMRKNNIYA